MSLYCLFLFFNGNNFAALVVSAVRADNMGKAHLSAVGASGQVAGFKGVMGAAAVAAALGMFAFWMWRHFVLLI